MSMVVIRFSCGHESRVAANVDAAPACPECGNGEIRRVKAHAPRFVGVATGPYCLVKALDAIPVPSIAPKGSLVIKEQES
jgi:predicted RNA-binding Zn-ribbon protein involved in translation (DUF1610 family)